MQTLHQGSWDRWILSSVPVVSYLWRLYLKIQQKVDNKSTRKNKISNVTIGSYLPQF